MAKYIKRRLWKVTTKTMVKTTIEAKNIAEALKKSFDIDWTDTENVSIYPPEPDERVNITFDKEIKLKAMTKKEKEFLRYISKALHDNIYPQFDKKNRED